MLLLVYHAVFFNNKGTNVINKVQYIIYINLFGCIFYILYIHNLSIFFFFLSPKSKCTRIFFKMQKVSAIKRKLALFFVTATGLRIPKKNEVSIRAAVCSSNARFLHPMKLTDMTSESIISETYVLSINMSQYVVRQIFFFFLAKIFLYHAHAIIQLNTEASVQWCPGNTGTVTPNVFLRSNNIQRLLYEVSHCLVKSYSMDKYP